MKAFDEPPQARFGCSLLYDLALEFSSAWVSAQPRMYPISHRDDNRRTASMPAVESPMFEGQAPADIGSNSTARTKIDSRTASYPVSPVPGRDRQSHRFSCP